MKQVFFKAIAGLIGGFVAWLIMEPSAPLKVSGSGSSMDPAFAHWSQNFILLAACLIAALVCFVSGLERGTIKRAALEVAIGILLAAALSLVGASVGQSLANGVFPGFVEQGSPLPVIVAWRVLGLTPIGLFLGVGIGAAGLSWQRMVQGAVGGTLGGLAAAASFDIVGIAMGPLILASRGAASGEIGGPSRALYVSLLGLGIGLFIGIADRVLTQAYVRLVLGRNEGREYAVDRPQFLLGRSELAGVPLFGDPAVMPQHAFISKQGSDYFLIDNNTQIGTALDGQRISQAPLHHGAWISIGQFQLQFLLKKAKPVPAAAHPGAMDMSRTYGGMIPPGQGYPGQPGQSPAGQVQQPYIPAPGPVPGQPVPVQPVPGQPVPAQTGPIPAGSPTMAVPAQAYQAGGFSITVTSGPDAGKSYPVTQQLEIGREGSGIRISTDIEASRRHAMVSPGPSGAMISDLSSTNGTFVNGQRVGSSPLNAGDVIKIGSTTFRIDRTS